MKKLNWSGFFITWILLWAAAAANESVNTFMEWLILGPGVGAIFSLFPLIVGKKD